MDWNASTERQETLLPDQGVRLPFLGTWWLKYCCKEVTCETYQELRPV